MIRDFFSGLADYINGDPRTILYNAIIIILLFFLIVLIIRVGLFLRRWRLLSKAKRQSTDFESTADYINKNKKSLNLLQRFFLGQTGIVLDKRTSIECLLSLIVGLLLGILLSCFETSETFLLIFYIIMLIIGVANLILSWEELVNHGRVFRFISFLILAVASLFLIYNVIA